MKIISNNLDYRFNPSFPLLKKQKINIAEEDILKLQDLFLTNGIHTILVPTLTEGRNLIYTFLDALRCYNEVGCFTKHSLPLKKDFFNITGHLQNTLITTEHYFSQDFNFDFIWIEHALQDQWPVLLKEKLINTQYDKKIPIIELIIKN